MNMDDYAKSVKRTDPNVLKITADDLQPRDSSIVDEIISSGVKLKISKTHLGLHDMADNELREFGLYFVTRKSFKMRRLRSKNKRSRILR